MVDASNRFLVARSSSFNMMGSCGLERAKRLTAADSKLQTMIALPALLLCLCIIHHANAFRFGRLSVGRGNVLPVVAHRERRTSSKLMMQMKHLQIPIQQDLAEYEKLVKTEIDERLLLRWYITHMDEQYAHVEAVHEDPQPDDQMSCPKMGCSSSALV